MCVFKGFKKTSAKLIINTVRGLKSGEYSPGLSLDGS